MNQNELDQLIAKALASTDSPDLAVSDSILEEVGSAFQGQYKWLAILAWTKMFAMVIIAMFSIYQFFQQDTVMAMVAYATVALACIVTMSSIYIMFWVLMNRNSTIREIKRLELQVALLCNKFDTRQGEVA